MTTQIPVIIDTDVAIDDWMALFYVLSNPACSVIGITTTGVGAAHLTPGTNNVLGLLQAAGQPSIPVASGTSAPLLYSNVFPGSWRATVDQAYGVSLPPNSNPTLSPSSAVQFLQSTILGSPSPVSILSIGGGTNLGTLFQQASSSAMQQLRANISGITMMGGVINQVGTATVPGNVNGFNGDYQNTVAEWNIFIDVLGASLMFNAGIPITLITLNACNQVPLDMNFYVRLQNFAKFDFAPAPAKIVAQGLANPGNLQTIQQGQYFFWDPLAAIALTDPGVVSTQSMNLAINQALNEEDDTSGQLVSNSSGPSINVAMSVANPFEVQSMLFKALTGGVLPPG